MQLKMIGKSLSDCIQMKPLIFSSVSVAGTSLVLARIFLSLRLYQNPQWSSRERAAGYAFAPEFPHFCIIDSALHLMWVCDHGKDGLGRQSSEFCFFFLWHIWERTMFRVLFHFFLWQSLDGGSWGSWGCSKRALFHAVICHFRGRC